MQTEAEVAELLQSLGFDQYPIIYDYYMGGEFADSQETTNDPYSKRPKYKTYFRSDSGNIYTISVFNGLFMAYPVSFNMESDLKAELVISESKELTIYSSKSDQYYVIIPFESNTLVKVIDKIDAESLNNLTNEEIRDYKN